MVVMEIADLSTDPLVILNPAANRGKMQLYRTLLRQRLERRPDDYVETSQPGEAMVHAMQAAREGRPIIIVGGDGSINEVVNGLLTAGRRVPLGIIASGSGNDFALQALKLPADPMLAIERAFTGRLIEVDAGKAMGKYFANSVTIGLDADIAAAAEALKKIPLLSGKRLYYTAILRQLLFGFQHCPWLTFRLDDDLPEQETEKRYILIAVTNGPTYGADFRIAPQADICDGLFDVCTIDYTPLLRTLRLLPMARKGQHAGLPEVTFYRVKKVHIQSRLSTNVNMDGEVVRAAGFDAEILPRALLVRV